MGKDVMGEVKTIKPDQSGDWYEAIILAHSDGIGVNNVDRDLFNKTFDAFMSGSYDIANAGFVELGEAGSSVAQYYLGMMYLNGKGVLQDFCTAHMWLNIAASKGHEKASKQLHRLTQSMVKEQVAEAQSLARYWVSRKSSEDTLIN